MWVTKDKKYPRIKVLVVHPSKYARDRIERFVSEKFGCKVSSTTNYDRAMTKLIKAAETGGPTAHFHVVVTARDISSPQQSALVDQGPALADAIKTNPLLKDIAVILECGKERIKDCKADIQLASLSQLEAWA